MASKSKRRRKVLGASCILAALIIAGSSFAWFTSKDEVTNRLSANADYGVSIVESFAPPANWIPGQEVNKDVYAINTGNIGAFVKEDVSGVLTYTVEQKTDTFSTDCVKLTADEVDLLKAGAFLAGAFDGSGNAIATVATGNINEYFNNGTGTDPKTTDDFTPTTAGSYFFRRVIKVGDATPFAEKFEYVGYYFDGTDYYKLAEIKINEIPEGYADDGINTDGTLTKAPTVLYAKETQAKAVPKLSYDATNNRLIATVKTGTDVDPSTLDGANVDTLAITADHALEALNEAKTNLDAAEAALSGAQSGYNAALATIAYYAGDTNKASIAATDLEGIDEDSDFSYATQGSASTISADKVVANGVLKTKIDNYNAAIAAYNGLTKPATYANVSTLLTTMNGAKTTMDASKSDFETKKAAYETAAGYEYTRPVTNPDPADAVYVVWAAENTYETDKAAYETAKANYDAAKADADTYDAQVANYKAQLDALKAAILADVGALNTAITARNASDPNGTGGTQSDYNTKKSLYDAALLAYNNALKTYNDAAAAYQAAVGNDTDIVIYINLSDAVKTTPTAKDQWQLADVVDGTDTTASFYYTGILQSSESSSKLIDSVTLASETTQDAYKSFDFDLNVALKSAQITYADDQKTILATAANSEFGGKTASVVNPTDIETPVYWN